MKISHAVQEVRFCANAVYHAWRRFTLVAVSMWMLLGALGNAASAQDDAPAASDSTTTSDDSDTGDDAPTPKADTWTEESPPAGVSSDSQADKDATYASGSEKASPRLVYKQSRPKPHFRRVHPVLESERSPADERPLPWWQWNQMTGDWAGVRSLLADHGVLFEVVYTGEAFTAANGGDPTSPPRLSGLGNIDVTLTLDTKGLGWWDGGTFFVYFENLHGNGNDINNAVGGAISPVSNLDADPFTQLSAYYFQQILFDGVWRLKFGKHDANSEFVASDITGEFINGGISPPVNIPYPTFPDPGLGFVTEVDPTDWMVLLGGVYGAELDGESFRDQGLFSGELLAIFELGLTASFLGRYAGTYRFGGWYTTLETAEIVPDNQTPTNFKNNYGWYFLFDQPLYLEKSAKDSSGQGLNSYIEFSWTPNDRNQVATFVSGGLMYTGAIPKRSADELGFAFVVSTISDNLPGFASETELEWFYKFFVTPWLAIQPDVQYLINVGGNGPNSVVLGTRGAVTF